MLAKKSVFWVAISLFMLPALCEAQAVNARWTLHPAPADPPDLEEIQLEISAQDSAASGGQRFALGILAGAASAGAVRYVAGDDHPRAVATAFVGGTIGGITLANKAYGSFDPGPALIGGLIGGLPMLAGGLLASEGDHGAVALVLLGTVTTPLLASIAYSFR